MDQPIAANRRRDALVCGVSLPIEMRRGARRQRTACQHLQVAQRQRHGSGIWRLLGEQRNQRIEPGGHAHILRTQRRSRRRWADPGQCTGRGRAIGVSGRGSATLGA